MLPVTLDNLSTGVSSAVKWGPLIVEDIRNTEGVRRAIREYKPGLVMHFAACAYVGESVTDPEKYYDNNIRGTHSLLTAMRQEGLDKIVFSSTCATYGIPKGIPISECTQQSPINPYGFTKYVIERELLDFGHAYGLRSAILRYFNAAGCDEEGLIGENHQPETHLIPLAILAALRLGPELIVYGTDYDTPDGTAIRDYVHVSDLANAHVMASERLLTNCPSSTWNLGTGRGTSVQEVINIVECLTGKNVPVRRVARRPGDPPILIADSRKAWTDFGWKPKFKDIAETIATAVAWFNRGKTQ